jgi:3-vinyl bacteriochlorophyllide hydratase
MLVLALHTAYLASLIFDLIPLREQMLLALAAYATYVINAGQFLLKLRAARLEYARSQTGTASPAAAADSAGSVA